MKINLISRDELLEDIKNFKETGKGITFYYEWW